MQKIVRWGKLLAGFILLLFLSTVSLPAYGANGDGCSTIAKEKVAEILKKMNIPVTEIGGIKQSPVEGICEIEVSNKGGVGVFYADLTLSYVMLGSLHDTRSMVNLTASSVQKLQDKKRVDLTQIALNESLAIGAKGATKKVIIFSDPD